MGRAVSNIALGPTSSWTLCFTCACTLLSAINVVLFSCTHTHVTHCAAVSERKNYNANLSRTPGSPLKQPKKATVKGGTLPLLLAKKFLVWVFSGDKQWEGRSVLSCLRLMGRIPEVGDKVSICAGNAKNGIVYSCIEEVRVVKEARDIVNRSNWKLFVPWVDTLSEALNVYVALDRGCGMVFIKLSYIESSENIGCKRLH